MNTWSLVLIGFGGGTVLALFIFLVCYARNYFVQEKLRKRSLLRSEKSGISNQDDDVFSPRQTSSEWEHNVRNRYFEEEQSGAAVGSLSNDHEDDLYDVQVGIKRVHQS